MIDAKAQFGMLADGSDETAKINAAFVAALADNEPLYFGPGIYGCGGIDPLIGPVDFGGAGIRRTEFKQLSTTDRMFEFQPGGGSGGIGSAFMRAENFTINQNSKTGSAIRLNTQFNGLRNVWVRDHKGGPGGDYAIHMTNATLADLENVHISNSDNCMAIVDSYYVNGRNVSIERQNGRALTAQNCAQTHFTGLYVDNGNPSSIGQTVPEVVLINGCSSFLVNGFSAELAESGSLVPNINDGGEDAKAYFLCKDSFNVALSGVRVNHTAPCPSSYIFYSKDGSLSLEHNEWHETVSGMVYAGCSSNNLLLSVDKTTTYNAAAGSKYGVGMFYGAPRAAYLGPWVDRAGVCAHYLRGTTIRDMR